LVLEKNPPKQGLKRKWEINPIAEDWSFREKSTKTRIETSVKVKRYYKNFWVLEKNPPKQGLKQ